MKSVDMLNLLSHSSLQCVRMETVHGTGYQTHKEWNDKNAQRALPVPPGGTALFETQSVTKRYSRNNAMHWILYA